MQKQTTLLIGQPGSAVGLARSLRRAYTGAGTSSVARLGFAYVSDSGLDTLLSQVGRIKAWHSTRKEWIVGLHHGITEPRALERIQRLPNSALKVFVGADRLSRASLLGGHLFHAKIIVVTSGLRSSSRPVCVLASSANLTGAALGADARNYEAGVALFGSSIPKPGLRAFREWWNRAASASIDATDDIVGKYARLRSSFLGRNPDALVGLDPPSLSRVRTARTLWIEGGAMSGGSRNQVEFSRDLAAFFGLTKPKTRLIRVRANEKEWDDRSLAHKVTTFGVDIWRLSLPTKMSGGFLYPRNVIGFRKTDDKDGAYFEVDVAMPNDPKAVRWRSMANRRGYVGVTSGQRSFGFF